MEESSNPQHHQPCHPEQEAPSLEVPQPPQQANQQPPPAPTLDYFIPPPINYLNSQYYQHLQSLQNPTLLFQGKFKNFGQQFSSEETPPSLPPQEPITNELKEHLRMLNRNIYSSMRKVLLREGRFGGEETVQELQRNLKMQIKQFLEICAKAKTSQIRMLRLREVEQETVRLGERTVEIRGELQQIKGELRGVSGVRGQGMFQY